MWVYCQWEKGKDLKDASNERENENDGPVDVDEKVLAAIAVALAREETNRRKSNVGKTALPDRWKMRSRMELQEGPLWVDTVKEGRKASLAKKLEFARRSKKRQP
jgi:hypothetical protein